MASPELSITRKTPVAALCDPRIKADNTGFRMRNEIEYRGADISSRIETNGENDNDLAESRFETLKQAEDLVFRLLEETAQAVSALASLRQKSKLSNWRVQGVYRELCELIKVMSVYR